MFSFIGKAASSLFGLDNSFEGAAIDMEFKQRRLEWNKMLKANKKRKADIIKNNQALALQRKSSSGKKMNTLLGSAATLEAKRPEIGGI